MACKRQDWDVAVELLRPLPDGKDTQFNAQYGVRR